MNRLKPTLIAATAALCVAGAAPALAQSANAFANASPNASFKRGAPGPLAGAGLPFLLVAGAVGAYKLARRRAETRQRRDDTGQRDAGQS